MELFAKLLLLVGALALLVLLSFLLSWPTMALINGLFTPSLIKAVFGVEQIGWTTAWGFNILCRILFKSYSGVSSK